MWNGKKRFQVEGKYERATGGGACHQKLNAVKRCPQVTQTDRERT